MKLYQAIKPLQIFLDTKRSQKLRIGFVPTMGSLHAGHISLIRAAKQKCDVVACSIFVNPIQFNNASDLEFYPRNIENDIKLLLEAGCDVLFHPKVDEMYVMGFEKQNTAGYGDYIHLLEGEQRPGHFDGVVTVVKRLFEIMNPQEVFFGQKDYQQCLVVKNLIREQFPSIIFNECPIEREADGLAMSSRNKRLDEPERKAATLLIKALTHLKNNWKPETWQSAIAEAVQMIENNPALHLEYLSVADPDNLKALDQYHPKAIALIAVKCQASQTRLIDNLFLY